jgi:hypothetical protein
MCFSPLPCFAGIQLACVKPEGKGTRCRDWQASERAAQTWRASVTGCNESILVIVLPKLLEEMFC